MGNTPIYIDGRTDRHPLKWGRFATSVSLLVIPTLEELDVIRGMDVLQRLGVKIDTRAVTAKLTLVASLIRPQETWMIPARKSVVFEVKKPFQEPQRNVLFELSEKLPTAIRGTTSLGKGNKFYICLGNTSEDDQVLNPEWEISTADVVDEEPDLPRAEIDEVGLPSILDDLSPPPPLPTHPPKKKNWRLCSPNFRMCSLGRGSNWEINQVLNRKCTQKGPPIRQPYRR